jgi:GDP-4-dehydro-6-deoxy-D-mannose reductase
MARILITGAQGFVGYHLVHSLLNDKATHEILGIGRSPQTIEHFSHRVTWLGKQVFAPIPTYLTHTDEKCDFRYERVDVCDRKSLVSLFKGFQPNWVFHLASGLRDDEPVDLCRINLEGATTLTQALVDSGCRPQMIVYGSSGAVYGHPHRLPLDEQAPTEPNDVYSATKLAAETVTRLLTRDYGLPAVWGRLFNLVGPGQDERHACAYFASRLASIAAGAAHAELTVGQLESTRDFIDVRDAVRALILLARHSIPGQVYNIARGTEVSIREVLTTLLRLADLKGRVEIKQGDGRKFDVPRQFADIRRLRSFGFTPRFTLSKSLKDSLHYYTHVVRTHGDSHAQQLRRDNNCFES